MHCLIGFPYILLCADFPCMALFSSNPSQAPILFLLGPQKPCFHPTRPRPLFYSYWDPRNPVFIQPVPGPYFILTGAPETLFSSNPSQAPILFLLGPQKPCFSGGAPLVWSKKKSTLLLNEWPNTHRSWECRLIRVSSNLSFTSSVQWWSLVHYPFQSGVVGVVVA